MSPSGLGPPSDGRAPGPGRPATTNTRGLAKDQPRQQSNGSEPTGVAVMDASEARVLTDRIKHDVKTIWALIEQAYTQRAWLALGYKTWDAYCSCEFGTSRLRLPREERRDVVSLLRKAGLSLRAIESATGASRKTVRNDLDQVGETTPPGDRPPITLGGDGKGYRTPPKPRPTPQELQRKQFSHALSRVQSNGLKLEQLWKDMAPADRRVVADEHLEYVVWAHAVVTRVLDAMDAEPDLLGATDGNAA